MIRHPEAGNEREINELAVPVAAWLLTVRRRVQPTPHGREDAARRPDEGEHAERQARSTDALRALHDGIDVVVHRLRLLQRQLVEDERRDALLRNNEPEDRENN